MQTLLERAKPEFISDLSFFEGEYPNTGAAIRSALAEYRFVSDLPYGVVMDIESMTKARSIWDLFSPFN
jgi:hypothetical protein